MGEKMEVPEEFPFPFPPYTIQDEFMRNLFLCLENEKLGIFESPTGTGKTLSIICGALKWLTDHEAWQKNNLQNKIDEIDKELQIIAKRNENDWFSVQTEQIKLNNERQSLQSQLDAVTKHNEKYESYKEMIKTHKIMEEKKKRQFVKYKNASNQNKKENEELTKNEHCSDEDLLDDDLILNDVDYDGDASDDEVDEEPYKNTKIFFCSRTHSQLAQFIGELKKTPYGQNISLVPLASRQNFCINPKVKQLKNINMINEQCIQLQKKKATLKQEKDLKKPKLTSCPFMPGNQSLLMADILSDVKDVEETAEVGKEMKTCPYYATRKSVEDGQLILVPYNSILHKSTRLSSGIDLKNNILIVDEAHNLLEAIERMHTITVTGKHLLHCYNQLSQYQKRFESVLSVKNVLSLNQLSFCLKKLLKAVGGTSKSHPGDKPKSDSVSKLYSLQDFETTAEIDTVNIFQLLEFIQKSKLIHKLRGYVEKYENNVKVNEVVKEKSGVTEFLKSLSKKKDDIVEPVQAANNIESAEEQIQSPLVMIASFLESLQANCADGRIFVVVGDTVGQGYLKFLLLNPAAHFSDIIQGARAVVLAGGTMEPMSEFKEQLFIAAGAKPERIVTFSCDHIIPEANITTAIVTSGPTGLQFEFNFQNRNNTKLLDELGRSLVNLCNIIPAGIVVFLPSYSYEELLVKHLESTGVLTKLRTKKQIFREPKSASDVTKILEKYANAIKMPLKPQNGALLFSVVGGKLSEGLNFSDDLGRCVIVVGMPYPNIKSPELQEKMKYLTENVNVNAGKDFYENSCMKAVNQCIGRAVRHINDYSTVVLLDKRYANKKKSLPGWIQRTLAVHTSFGMTVGSIAKFFATKRNATSRS